MTLETHKETSSNQYTFQLDQFELSYLRNVMRNNIEDTSILPGGKFHSTAKVIYAKLCQGYIDNPHINQQPGMVKSDT